MSRDLSTIERHTIATRAQREAQQKQKPAAKEKAATAITEQVKKEPVNADIA